MLFRYMMTAESIFIERNGNIPNNDMLPMLIYRQVFTHKAEENFRKNFNKNGWKGIWVNGIFSYHHYHSNAHEVLGVTSGNSVVILGGPEGEEVPLSAGDMVVLPAGTGHCLKESSHDFKVIGAYPEGQENYDICTQQDDLKNKTANIGKVALPPKDPVYGNDGPLKQIWI